MPGFSSPHRVLVLALPGVVAFDLSTAAQVFGFRDEYRRYSFSVCSSAPGPVPTSTGFTVQADAGLEALLTADTVILPGYYPALEPDPSVSAALRAAYERGTRLASVCVGAFALAATGLLDGRRATTHWREAEEFQRRYPAVRLNPDVLFVDGGQILTSAGQAASIDFYLHLVRTDYGAAAAAGIARRMVVATHRAGGQTQDAHRTARERDAAEDELSLVMEWAIDQMHQPLSLALMARRAGLPTRTFSRRFQQRTAMTPMRWLSSQRLLEAQRLLETSDITIDGVAERCGLGSAANLRLHMARELGTTPSSYRSTHRRPEGAARDRLAGL